MKVVNNFNCRGFGPLLEDKLCLIFKLAPSVCRIRMPHDLSHLGFLAGQIGRLITISTTPVIAGDSFEMDAVGALRLSPLRRGLAIDSTVDIFTFYVPHRHVYGEQWIKFMKDGVNATPLPT